MQFMGHVLRQAGFASHVLGPGCTANDMEKSRGRNARALEALDRYKVIVIRFRHFEVYAYIRHTKIIHRPLHILKLPCGRIVVDSIV